MPDPSPPTPWPTWYAPALARALRIAAREPPERAAVAILAANGETITRVLSRSRRVGPSAARRTEAAVLAHLVISLGVPPTAAWLLVEELQPEPDAAPASRAIRAR